MYFDGSLMIEGAGAGIMLISPTGKRLKYVLQLHFPASNNAAEYEDLLHGLRISISLGIRRLAVRGDSELVENQVQKEYSCTSTKMSAYYQEVQKLEGTFDGLELHMCSGTTTMRLTSWRRWVPSRPRSQPVSLFNSSTSR